jgi:hypothetical protein
MRLRGPDKLVFSSKNHVSVIETLFFISAVYDVALDISYFYYLRQPRIMFCETAQVRRGSNTPAQFFQALHSSGWKLVIF